MSSKTSAPPYLDEDRIERLADLLDRRAVPFKGLNLEALDGFLTALAVSPSTVPPEEWQPVVWGGKAPTWDGEAEADQVQQLLLGHLNMCTARVRYDDGDLPDHLAPLMWLPEDPELTGEDALNEDELDVGTDWAHGFFSAVMLREAEWDQWLDDNDWIEDIFDALDRLASGEAINPDDPTAEAMPVDYRERLGIVIEIPSMMADLNHHRVEALTPRTPIRATRPRNATTPAPAAAGRNTRSAAD